MLHRLRCIAPRGFVDGNIFDRRIARDEVIEITESQWNQLQRSTGTNDYWIHLGMIVPPSTSAKSEDESNEQPA